MSGPGSGRNPGARSPAPGEPPRTGYFTAAYTSAIDGSEQPFALWVSESYSSLRKYPLVVALHGMDADHRMIPEQCLGARERELRADVILLSPFGRGDVEYRWMGEADVWDTINWVKARYSIDSRRQYLTGLSMGGYATWRLACAYPDQWAAIAPVCGGGTPSALGALKQIPVWCVHGERDELVPVQESRRLIAELRRLRYSFRYNELRGWGHNSWEWLYHPDRFHGPLMDWFLRFRKRRTPVPMLAPKREGTFLDLFSERLIISCPTRTLIPREPELLLAEAETLSRFQFGDFAMRSGRLHVKPDTELSPKDLRSANHLMLGRTDNHCCLKSAARGLAARHIRGRLEVGGEAYLGKSLIAATCQTSPWNPDRLLGVITYQQFQQMRGVMARLLDPAAGLLAINLYDTQQRRFIRREKLA